MNSKIKHPMHILVIDKEFTDELPGMNLKHGVTRWTGEQQYAYWLEAAVAHLMTGQREKMEYDPRFRQILPYTPVVFSDTPESIDWANSPIFLYQRTKKIGEERLAGNYSIGTGGHVDHADAMVIDGSSILDFEGTVSKNLMREVASEELTFALVDGTRSLSPITDPDSFKFVPFGLIRDDSNNVGKVHLGVVNVIVVPTWMRVRCKEEELITCDPMTATELKASGLKFEGWTQILIDAFLGVECSVAPTPCREATFDIMSGNFFITSRKGDKWTELAIEFNTTVATLYRLNMANYESNEIDEGTRVNVPDQGQDMVRVDTPQHLIDALNSDTEGARAKAKEIVGKVPSSEEDQAKMAELVLQGILNHGPDYENCGLVFLVTPAMGDRLAALNSEIIPLIEKGIVSIVSEDSLPNTDAIAVGAAEAEQVKEGRISWMDSNGQLIKAAPNPLPPLEFDSNAGKPGEAIVSGQGIFVQMPNPTEQDLQSPLFEAIWQAIKNWDVNVPSSYGGYCGATGSHVKIILDSILAVNYAESPVRITGDIGTSGELIQAPDELMVEDGFKRQVLLGEANDTPRHVLQNGDSINSICEQYKISKEDFDRWNGFERGHAWPTSTGYVFIADPALKWIPLLETGINEVSPGRGDTKSYEEPTM
jgi:predicted NUDIX family phosphoesterase/LysM repeat protein